MWKDDANLLEMLKAARKIEDFLRGRNEADFQADAVLQHAVMMLLTVIGESAYKVSKPIQDAHPEIPWRPSYGMRNILVHAYGDINLGKVWLAASVDVPELVRNLEPLVPPDDGVEPTTKLTPREPL